MPAYIDLNRMGSLATGPWDTFEDRWAPLEADTFEDRWRGEQPTQTPLPDVNPPPQDWRRNVPPSPSPETFRIEPANYVPDSGDGYYHGGGDQVASLTGDGVYNNGGRITGNMSTSGPPAASFNDRFTFGQQQFNYQSPSQAAAERPWWMDSPGETVIGDPPSSSMHGQRSNTPTSQGFQQFPMNYDTTPYGQSPTVLDTYQGTPHQFDQTAPANTFNSRFNAVDPAVNLGAVDSFDSRFPSADQSFSYGNSGPSYDDYTRSYTGDFDSGDMTQVSGRVGSSSGLDLPGSMSYVDPSTLAHYTPPQQTITHQQEYTGPGGGRVAPGNSGPAASGNVPVQPSLYNYASYQPASSFIQPILGF